MGGAIFENLVAVDLILEAEARLIPLEVKLTATPRPEMANAISVFRKDFGERVGPGYIVHAGNMLLPLGSNVLALPFSVL